MGPFELMDLTGVDINYPAYLIMHEQNSYDPRIRTVSFHKILHDSGRFGRKTGHSNYRYDTDGKMIETPNPDYNTDARPTERLYVAAGADIFSDLLAGAAFGDADDSESPIVAALYGEDCSTFAVRNGIDYMRLVGIDPTGDLSKRVTVMTPPGAN